MTKASLLNKLTKDDSEASSDAVKTKMLQEMAKTKPEETLKYATTLVRASTVAICLAAIMLLGQISSYSFNREVLDTPWLFGPSVALTIILLTILGETIKARSRLERDREELIVYTKP